ncbi:MAG TPA: hypothetical protein PK890_09040, partial [Terrimesophilobacter sp.]|nr:hypothetical protein [Terrimesophilobacter sp.]
DYLATVDVDAIEPDPEWVAGLLHAVGRPDDVSRLIPGAVASDFDAEGSGWHGPVLEYFSDARVLHQALTQEVFNDMSDVLIERMPDFDYGWHHITARIEIQCTTDPGRSGDQ